jgi:hypothetical protein
MNHMFHTSAALVVLLPVVGCGKGWQLDYGQPAAQFNEDTVLAKAPPYICQKVTVKGVVTRQDLSDPEHCKICSGHSICCNLGKF